MHGLSCARENQSMLERMILICTIATWFVAAPAFASELPSKTIKCWEFKQRNKLFGDCKIYASPKAFKLIGYQDNWMDLAKAPKWDVCFIGKNHLYYRSDLNDLKGHILITLASAMDTRSKPVKANQQQTIAGIMT